MHNLDQDSTLLFLFTLTIISWILFYLYHKSTMESYVDKVTQLENENTTLSTELHKQKMLPNETAVKYAALVTEHNNLQSRFIEVTTDTQKMSERFENLATKILEEKAEKFDEVQRKGITEILAPLKERIVTFEQKVEATNKESIERHSSLKQQIIGLAALNEKMSKEAINLTKALKGDSKQQGNWGELILESILDKSGLQKDREYFVQKSLTDEEGKRFQPDVVICLPDGKKLIVDSKVSLKAYDQLVNAENEEASNAAQKLHTHSVKRHIENLAEKNYHDLYKIESPDFVLMFVPIDTAFSAALSGNADLYNYAFEKNIVIVTPSTLLATLKTVETMWRNENQNRYAIDIASEAGKMYDKFSAFVADLEKLGKQIDTTQLTYQESMKKLHFGRGDLISRAEKLKSLGAKANKQLPKHLIEESKETNA